MLPSQGTPERRELGSHAAPRVERVELRREKAVFLTSHVSEKSPG